VFSLIQLLLAGRVTPKACGSARELLSSGEITKKYQNQKHALINFNIYPR